MSDLCLNILRGELADFFVVNRDKTSYVCTVEPYAPFSGFPNECGTVDAYYLVSNRIYHRDKRIAELLRANGIPASASADIPLKQTLCAAGLLNTARNTLCWTERFGTYFYIGCIKVETELEQDEGNTCKMCSDCGKCIAACPTGAITKDGFCREKCLRQHMENGSIPDAEVSRKLGVSLLGCDSCQRVCPLNREIKTVPPPKAFADSLKLEPLFLSLMRGERPGALAELIGANYARRAKLLPLVVNAMGNTGNQAFLTLLEPFAVTDANAARAVEKLRNAAHCEEIK